MLICFLKCSVQDLVQLDELKDMILFTAVNLISSIENLVPLGQQFVHGHVHTILLESGEA